jgi:hypothetical protein
VGLVRGVALEDRPAKQWDKWSDFGSCTICGYGKGEHAHADNQRKLLLHTRLLHGRAGGSNAKTILHAAETEHSRFKIINHVARPPIVARYEKFHCKTLGPLHPAATVTVESFLRCGDLAAGFTR